MKRAKTKSHKKQHFVSQGYLKAWCDPKTLAGETPYVWLFNKDGSNPRRKAPRNVFSERDLYTIHGVDGGRDLILEHGLAELESQFVRIRDAKLLREPTITQREHVILCAFIAATHARTPTQRDHLAGQWTKLLGKMEHMRAWALTATPEQRRAIVFPGGSPAGRPRWRMSYEDVKRLAEQPMQTMLVPMVQAETPLLMRLDILVLTSREAEMSFITSDYPCVWFDPEAYKRPPFFQKPALMYRSIEITLPVSPHQIIVLNRHGLSGYADATRRMVDEYNRRTRFECSEYFVSNSNHTEPIWFDPGVEPDDSWRKQPPD